MTRTTTLLLLSLCVYLSLSQPLSPVSLSPTGVSPSSLPQLVAQQQPLVTRKAVLHYLQHTIPLLAQTLTPKQVVDKVLAMFSADKLEAVQGEVQGFMKGRLVDRFGIGGLSESFRNEIDTHPEYYFITYDIYDLIYDE